MVQSAIKGRNNGAISLSPIYQALLAFSKPTLTSACSNHKSRHWGSWGITNCTSLQEHHKFAQGQNCERLLQPLPLSIWTTRAAAITTCEKHTISNMHQHSRYSQFPPLILTCIWDSRRPACLCRASQEPDPCSALPPICSSF